MCSPAEASLVNVLAVDENKMDLDHHPSSSATSSSSSRSHSNNTDIKYVWFTPLDLMTMDRIAVVEGLDGRVHHRTNTSQSSSDHLLDDDNKLMETYQYLTKVFAFLEAPPLEVNLKKKDLNSSSSSASSSSSSTSY